MLPAIPKNVVYGELGYRREAWFARLEAMHKSRVAVNDANSDFADDYTVWNAVAGLVQQRDRLQLTEFVRMDNLTDRDYVGSVIVNENSGRYFEPAPRRAWTVALHVTLRF
jgi:iron complex outermembrane receptor protein